MLKNILDGKPDNELSHIKFDYRNKYGENSRNEYFKKTLKTSFVETRIKVPMDCDDESEP